MDTITHAAPPRRRRAGRRLSRRDDLITLALATWLTIGVFVDGWAHSNLAALETFFTPWHALLYSGFAVNAAWLGWLVIRGQEAGQRGLAAVPAGYRLGLAGVAIFGLGGAGDFTWHAVFGIEQDLEALFSPTHLLLALGIGLIVTSPLRAAWTDPDEGRAQRLATFLPPLMSVTLLAALILFFLMEFAPLTDVMAGITEADWGGSNFPGDFWLQAAGIAGGLLTNVVLMAAVLYLLRRWRPPFGSVTVLFTVIGLGMNVLNAFETIPLLAPVVLAGLAADLLIRRLRPSPDRPGALRTVAVAVPLVLWSAYYLTVHLMVGMAWPPELWTGMIVYNALAGLLLAQLMLPVPTRAAAAA